MAVGQRGLRGSHASMPRRLPTPTIASVEPDPAMIRILGMADDSAADGTSKSPTALVSHKECMHRP